MSFADIEHAITDFSVRAQKNQIGLDELEGGTFTITKAASTAPCCPHPSSILPKAECWECTASWTGRLPSTAKSSFVQ